MDTSVPIKEDMPCYLRMIMSVHSMSTPLVFSIAMPPEIKSTNIGKLYNNSNIIVLIIEPM